MQSNHSYGQRLFVDELGNAHINWMKMDSAADNRFCAWNFRSAGGSYFGETQASPSWSGWAQLDVMRDGSARTVIAYHYNAGAGYCSWIDIDSANGAGSWPNDPKTPAAFGHIWPKFTISSNNNILLATGDQNHVLQLHHLYLTTDLGVSWNHVATFDSCCNLTHFLRASRTEGSNKVVFIHTQYMNDSVAVGQLDQDVWYMLSYNDGQTWASRTNMTNYQPYPTDSVRAFADVNAAFDANDILHIVWAGRKVTDNYYNSSKIFHWDELHDTITNVNSPSIYYSEPGGWWIKPDGYWGSWRMPADRPELIIDTISGYMYCVWHGNDDYTDTSAAGWPNGELYGSYSTNNGITWSDYVNLTNTRSPGAGPGYCDDEDYATVHPYVINDSIWLTYIEDKDAGNWADAEGTRTSNPVRCWVFPTSLITGIEEDQASSAKFQESILRIEPNPFTTQCVVKIQAPESKNQIDLKIFDASGRLVNDFFLSTAYSLVPTTILWSGTDQAGHRLPAGVYFVELTGGDEIITRKVVKLR
jgi:hypothetical protein